MGKIISFTDRALPYLSFVAQQAQVIYSAHQQNVQFEASKEQTKISQALSEAQMKQSFVQFAASQAIQKALAARQLQQQQDQFTWQQGFQQEQAGIQKTQGLINIGLQAGGIAANGVGSYYNVAATTKLTTAVGQQTQMLQGLIIPK